MAPGVYGRPPAGLVDVPAGATQYSPLIPGSARLEEARGLDEIVVAAPPGTIERRFVLACAMRALKPGGRLTALAPKDRGGSRLAGELRELTGGEITGQAKSHHRVCVAMGPAAHIEDHIWIEQGHNRLTFDDRMYTQPGVFSWDREDPGSALLAAHLPVFSGKGADLGCGIGVLARVVLASQTVETLDLIDIDRRAVDCARLSVVDPRASFHWADVREASLTGLDFVISNPPFHENGNENKALGAAFIAAAAGMLKKDGVFWLVANRHLPYEQPLKTHFKSLIQHADSGGFKILEARR